MRIEDIVFFEEGGWYNFTRECFSTFAPDISKCFGIYDESVVFLNGSPTCTWFSFSTKLFDDAGECSPFYILRKCEGSSKMANFLEDRRFFGSIEDRRWWGFLCYSAPNEDRIILLSSIFVFGSEERETITPPSSLLGAKIGSRIAISPVVERTTLDSFV